MDYFLLFGRYQETSEILLPPGSRVIICTSLHPELLIEPNYPPLTLLTYSSFSPLSIEEGEFNLFLRNYLLSLKTSLPDSELWIYQDRSPNFTFSPQDDNLFKLPILFDRGISSFSLKIASLSDFFALSEDLPITLFLPQPRSMIFSLVSRSLAPHNEVSRSLAPHNEVSRNEVSHNEVSRSLAPHNYPASFSISSHFSSPINLQTLRQSINYYRFDFLLFDSQKDQNKFLLYFFAIFLLYPSLENLTFYHPYLVSSDQGFSSSYPMKNSFLQHLSRESFFTLYGVYLYFLLKSDYHQAANSGREKEIYLDLRLIFESYLDLIRSFGSINPFLREITSPLDPHLLFMIYPLLLVVKTKSYQISRSQLI